MLKAKNYVKPQIREAQKKLVGPNAHKTRWNIVRGDRVEIRRGHPEKGKQGIVKKVIRKTDRVIVEGVNVFKKHVPGVPERGIPSRLVLYERSIHYSNVSLVDPVTNAPTRITRQKGPDGKVVRISKKSGTVIPRPPVLEVRSKPKNFTLTKDCTPDEDAWAVSYQPLLERMAEETDTGGSGTIAATTGGKKMAAQPVD